MTRIFTLICSLLVVAAQAQLKPFGYQWDAAALQSLPVAELATFDHAQLLAEDTRTEELGGRTNIGRLIDLHMDDQNAGVWSELANGDRVWQYRFRSANAKGVCMYFDNLYIPEGAVMFLYSIDRKTFVGPFTNEDCNAHGHFMMGEVLGDEAILEYYEPVGVLNTPRIGMQAAGHMYRYVYDYAMYEDGDNSRASDPCEVDVNCPEGTDWVGQRDAVVRLLITEGNTQGLCSGSIVNNTQRDCRKLLLTALHCGVNVTDSEWLQCSVRFKYQKAGCGSGAAPSTSNRVGVVHLADANDNGGDTGSDFLLLEIEDAIPSTYNVYYAGWDSRTTTPADVVGIHHPSGDVKKISTATTIVSATWSAPGHHWQVNWMATETNHGVTEGGSSGSPLFNQDKRIVGHLTGGASFCTSPTSPDFYGKLDRDWDDNPNTADQKLKVFLDPQNTGETFMDGAYPSADGTCIPSGIQEILEFSDVNLFPTMADQSVRLQSSRFREIAGYRVFNANGTLVYNGSFRNETETLNTGNLPSGVYFVTFDQNNGAHLTKKMVVEHR